MKPGIAYGFFRSQETLEDLEQALAEGRTTAETPISLATILVPLEARTQFPSANADFSHRVRQALGGGMNYVLEATLPGTDNHHTAQRLALLLVATVGQNGQGVCYLADDEHYHYLQDKDYVPRD